MAFDYVSIRKIADELIREFGRDCTVEYRYSEFNGETRQQQDFTENTTGQCVFCSITDKQYQTPDILNNEKVQQMIATASCEVKPSSIVSVANEKYSVIQANPIKPADINCCTLAIVERIE